MGGRKKPIKNRRRISPISDVTKELQEAREQQAATAEILKVIASSPSEVQPVFEAIAASANRLIGGFSTAVLRFIDGMVHLAAFTPTNPDADAVLTSRFPTSTATYRPFALAARGEPVQIADTEAAPDEEAKQISRARGYRSLLLAPLMSGGQAIGTIGVTRATPGAFAPHHVQLLQTFADQAVIAIENVRLFNETKEALERQTATADVLNVIGRSPTDAAPVFDVIGERAERLCNAEISVVSVLDGDLIKLAGIRGISSEGVELFRANFPMPLDRQTVTARTIKSGAIVHISDVLADPAYDNKGLAARTGYRRCLGVPMHNKGQVVGAIFVARTEPGLFSDSQVHLLQIFADQAVIAMENVRLFNETQEALERQTATAEVLQVISSSPGELGPVFEAMLENAVRICRASFGTLLLYEGDRLRRVARMAAQNVPQLYAPDQETPPHFIAPFDGAPSLRRLVETKALVHIADIATEHPDDLIYKVAAARTVLIVPMLKESELVGAFAVYRKEVQEFSDKQVELLENFAAQAVIAIENTRLLKELRERTDDLSRSLHELRTAQDRLIQTEKLASLGQLTAGIAHEIKNPLNFVNNFSALSAELTDELNDLLKHAALTDTMREEVDELTKLLKENLEKVVQHGKRADSIVKNMLLHSREGSGEQRAADINAIVEDSLNLAYHGARAEKSGFTITLRQNLDPRAGAVELYPQEITRALLNLISNGFYAATRRKVETGDESFEPVLSASTRNLGTTVEIRIRDNGTGILPEVREKMFNPFFTTKPTGEGTGLGLSMTHDIIVKQHGGRIDVETEPGVFTEFIITLPRDNGIATRPRSE
jgi:two-component system, NtrC family, sensor kinase